MELEFDVYRRIGENKEYLTTHGGPMRRLKEITPNHLRNICWPLPGCPALFISEDDDQYVLIGKHIDAADYGIADRVAQGEVAISVPKQIFEELPPSQ